MEREADIMLRCSVLPRTATSGRLQKVTGDVEIVPYCPDPGPQAMTDRETELQKLVAIYGADERLPSQEQWRKVIAVEPGKPIIIVNLIGLHAGTVKWPEIGFEGPSSEAWTRYGELAAPMMGKYGVSVENFAELDFSVIGSAEKEWDIAVLARYRDSRAFIDLHLDDEYCEKALPLRRLVVRNHRMFLSQTRD